MFEKLTAGERGKLAELLGHAASQFRDEYAALCSMPDTTAELLAGPYQFPAAGPSAWLGAATDAVFAAAEVSGATGSSCYWVTSR
jgi:hypothetical protein